MVILRPTTDTARAAGTAFTTVTTTAVATGVGTGIAASAAASMAASSAAASGATSLATTSCASAGTSGGAGTSSAQQMPDSASAQSQTMASMSNLVAHLQFASLTSGMAANVRRGHGTLRAGGRALHPGRSVVFR